jgi:hypothetical protein
MKGTAMSDNSISIVPRISIYPNREHKAQEILDWLISRDIVEAEPSDCVLSQGNGYAISAGAKKVVLDEIVMGEKDYNYNHCASLATNGLAIITEKSVFTNMGGDVLHDWFCPHCGQDISVQGMDCAGAWWESETGRITCPLCGADDDIHQFRFTTDGMWGFSDLGVEFWNWPQFTPVFLDEFRQKLGCDISVVYAHL